jgi:hypothetical protein
MSWKFGGIYIKPGFEDPEEALHFLQIDKRFTYQTISFSDVVNSAFGNTAIGIINGISLVHDNLLPYNNSYEAGTSTDADFNMMELSRTAEIIPFFLDGTSESYGLNHFKDGKRISRYAVTGGELILNEGDIAAISKKRGEAKILEYLQQFTGISFQALLNNDTIKMYLFTGTGF